MTLNVFAAAAVEPDRTALLGVDRSWTYAQLAQAAAAAVSWLHQQGLVRGPAATPAALGLVATNEPATVQLLHALVALGVPVLLLDPRLTPPERARRVKDANAAAVLDSSWTAEAAQLPPVSPIRAVPDDEKSKIKDHLRERLSDQFEIRQEINQRRLTHLGAELARLREHLTQRTNQRDALIERELQRRLEPGGDKLPEW